MNVTLPNGNVIKNVPDNATKEQIKQKAIAAGLAVESDFPQVQPVEPKVSVDPAAMTRSAMAGKSPHPMRETGVLADASRYAEDIYNSSIYQFMRGNAEIPGGMAGGMAGAGMGLTLGGPPGMVLGGILGGAAGSAGGSLLSDKALGEEYDFAKAAEEAAWSMGIDAALLGIGKITKGAWRMYKAAGKSPQEVVEELARAAQQAPKAGTAESIAQTQAALSQGGATLTPYQTGKASAWDTIKQQFGEVGIFSKAEFDRNAELVNDVARKEFERIMGGGTGMQPAELGEAVYTTIARGKQALGDTFDAAMTTVKEGLKGDTRVPVTRLMTVMDDFKVPRVKEVGTMLDKDTIRVIDELQTTLDTLPTGGIKTEELLDLEKLLRDRVSELGDFNNKLYNATASRELAQLSEQVREGILREIYRIDPELAKTYSAAKSAYSKGVGELLPEMTKSMLTQGGKDNFDTLGRALTNVTNVSKAESVMNSVRRAYSEAKRAGFTDLPFESVRDANKVIRQSYLSELFKGADGASFDINSFKTLAAKMEKPSEAAKMQAILGEAYAPTKRLLNLMSDATQTSSSNIGQLALRTKEYAAGAALVGGGTYATTGDTTSAVASAVAVLAIPKFWAKAATDPATANRLLAFNKAKYPTVEAAAVAFSNMLADIVDKDDSYKELVKETTASTLSSMTSD